MLAGRSLPTPNIDNENQCQKYYAKNSIFTTNLRVLVLLSLNIYESDTKINNSEK